MAATFSELNVYEPVVGSTLTEFNRVLHAHVKNSVVMDDHTTPRRHITLSHFFKRH